MYMYIYICMCICVYIYICMYVYISEVLRSLPSPKLSAQVGPGYHVFVSGAGPIGLMTAMCAKAPGLLRGQKAVAVSINQGSFCGCPSKSCTVWGLC